MNEWCCLELRLVDRQIEREVCLSKRLTLKENIDMYLELENICLPHYFLVRRLDNCLLNNQTVLADLHLNEGEGLDIYPYPSAS